METVKVVRDIVMMAGAITIALTALRFISIRPTREEVNQMIDRSLEAVNTKIDHIQNDVKFIREIVEKKKR